MSEELSGPSPEGVIHGPYPLTEAHPWDQANGHSSGILEAYSKDRINLGKAELLEANLGAIVNDAYTEELSIHYEDDEARHYAKPESERID